MSAKPEEVTQHPTEGAVSMSDAGVEKKPELEPTDETPGKEEVEAAKVDDTTTGVANLSVADEEKAQDKAVEEQKVEEKKKAEDTPVSAVPEAKGVDTTPAPTGPVWPETSADHPLIKFYDVFESLTTEASHNEVYGIELTKSNPFHTKLILQKFLRANQNDLGKAKQQLLETLKWRKEFDPVKAMDESFDQKRFDGLGYVLEVEGVPESPNKKDIVTFNIYGAVKDNKATFGDLDGYMPHRTSPCYGTHFADILRSVSSVGE